MKRIDWDKIVLLTIIFAIIAGAIIFFPYLRGWLMVNIFKSLSSEHSKLHYTFWDYWKVGFWVGILSGK